VFVHATGFCKELWLPVVAAIEEIDGPTNTVLVDQRGHGHNAPHPGPFDWHSVAMDIVETLERTSGPVVGIGHSSGGAALARAEILRPGSFSRLVLIEPIIFPGPYERRDIPFALGAERRRRSFPSREAARLRFASGPFASWDPTVLDLYLDNGFEPTSEGWTLRCSPEVEAEVFREGSNVDTWDHLGAIECQVTVVVAQNSDSHQEPYVSLLMERFADSDLVVLDGLSHLAPMEDPTRMALVIVGG
jgi:pimeloyl-ACP methyl ester carboxylesterase